MGRSKTSVVWRQAPRGSELHQELEIMQAEFESSCLEVALVPTRYYVNHGGCVRVAINRNCDWYRRFCAKHPSARRRLRRQHDTRIKRANVASLLQQLLGRGSWSKYAEELIGIARARLKKRMEAQDEAQQQDFGNPF